MQHSKNAIKTVLLFVSAMTVMAGAILAPALTDMAAFFNTSSDVLIKLIITMPALIIAIVGSLVGKLSDSVGRKNLLVGSLIIYGIGGFSGFWVNDIYLLLASRAVLGLGVAGIMSIGTTLIGDYFKGTERGRFMGSQASFMAIGGMVFLLLGGFLADLSWRFPFALYLLSFVLLPFVIWILHEPQKEEQAVTEESSVKIDVKRTTLIYTLGFLGMLFFYMIPTQLPFLLQERLEVNSSLVGLAIATFTFTSAISALNYNKVKRRLSYLMIFIVVFILMSTGYLFIAYFHTYLGILMGIAVGGFGGGFFLANCNLWLIEIAPVEKRGHVIGGITSMFFAGQFMSPLIVAIALFWVDLTTAFYIAWLLMGGLGLVLYLTRRHFETT